MRQLELFNKMCIHIHLNQVNNSSSENIPIDTFLAFTCHVLAFQMHFYIGANITVQLLQYNKAAKHQFSDIKTTICYQYYNQVLLKTQIKHSRTVHLNL